MSVPKRKRTTSQFEVFAGLTAMRNEITNLALRDFGYSAEKAAKRLEQRLGGKRYEDLSPEAQINGINSLYVPLTGGTA